MLRNSSALFSLAVVAPLALACGSSSKNGQEGNSPGFNATSTSTNTSTGTTTVTSTGNPDGGDKPITSDQVTAIKTASCAAWTGILESVPAKLQLVVDISNSMSQSASGSSESKWAITQNALIQAIVGDGTTSHTGLSSTMAVGVLFYPNKTASVTVEQQPVTACIDTSAMIPLAQLGDDGTANSQRAKIRQAFQNAVLAKGTPTFDAYTYALNSSTLSAAAQAIQGASYQLLITDGEPTIAQGCSNPNGDISSVETQPIVDAIQAAWTQHGVKTFVIGSPGSESTRDWLSQAAVYGQTSAAGCNVSGPTYCHMDMTTAPDFSAALGAGLAQVASQMATCTYMLPPTPTGKTLDLTMVNVIANTSTGSHLLLQDTAGDCTVGWQYDASNNVKLCSQTCAMVQADPTATVDVAVVCASAIDTIIN